MAKEITIGIDIGTSGCKSVAVRGGRVLASATEHYPLYTPRAGRSEQNPSDWWGGVCRSVRSVCGEINVGDIAAISLSGQMHGMVALGKNREVIRPAILWNDQRTQKQCDEIASLAGGLDGLLEHTNNRMLTGYTGGKILWMRENEPENFRRTVKIINPKDYILYRLTGEIKTDMSDASGTGLFDVESRSWAVGLLNKLGLDPALFASPLESVEAAGNVMPIASDETGLPKNIPVYAGGGDAVVSAISMGLVPGNVGVTLGTSGVVAVRLPEFAKNPGGLLQVFCGNLPKTWVAFGCTLSAAGSYQWLRDRLFSDMTFDALNELAGGVPAGSGGLMFTPYLTGERCPLFDANATGGFWGLTANMGRGHFARAVMEGVAFSLRQVYNLICESAKITSKGVVAGGGGTKGVLWRQILADVFGLPVSLSPGAAEGGAYGAALIAGIGHGLYDPDTASGFCRAGERVHPIGENVAAYEKAYAKYARLYESVSWINREEQA